MEHLITIEMIVRKSRRGKQPKIKDGGGGTMASLYKHGRNVGNKGKGDVEEHSCQC